MPVGDTHIVENELMPVGYMYTQNVGDPSMPVGISHDIANFVMPVPS